MKRARRARIVATRGPSTSGEAAIRALFEAGVDVFRLNLSHGSRADHAQRSAVLPPEEVLELQRLIVRSCRAAGKPVVVATQMLESMIHAPVPTRAEVSDIATAVHDGVDAVMLSAESASGDFPVEAVAMMNRIITRTESSASYRAGIDASRIAGATTVRR